MKIFLRGLMVVLVLVQLIVMYGRFTGRVPTTDWFLPFVWLGITVFSAVSVFNSTENW